MTERRRRFSGVKDTAEEVQTPLLENMVVGVPPVFGGLTREIDQLVEQPLLGPKTDFPTGMCVQVWDTVQVYNGTDSFKPSLRLPVKMPRASGNHRLSPIGGTKQSSPRTLWELSVGRWMLERRRSRHTSISRKMASLSYLMYDRLHTHKVKSADCR